MKTLLITFSCVCLFTSMGHGQVQSYLKNIRTSSSGISVAELSVIHRSREDDAKITELGTQLVMFSNTIGDKDVKVEYYRFRTMEGLFFTIDDKYILPVHLYYDNETVDPRDDRYIMSVPFEIPKEIIFEEENHWLGKKSISLIFTDAMLGETKVPRGDDIKLQKGR